MPSPGDPRHVGHLGAGRGVEDVDGHHEIVRTGRTGVTLETQDGHVVAHEVEEKSGWKFKKKVEKKKVRSIDRLNNHNNLF